MSAKARRLIKEVLSSLKLAVRNPRFSSFQGPQLAQIFAGAAFYFASAVVLSDESRGFAALIMDLSYLALTVLLFGSGRAMVMTSEAPRVFQSRVARRLTRPIWFFSPLAILAGFTFLLFGGSGSAIALILVGCVTGILAQNFSKMLVAGTSRENFFPYANFVFPAVIVAGVLVLLSRHEQNEIAWVLLYVVAGSVLFLPPTKISDFDVKGNVEKIRHESERLRTLGLQLFPAELGEFLLGRLDRILVGLFLGLNSLGAYIILTVFFELLRPGIKFWLEGNYLAQYVRGSTPNKPSSRSFYKILTLMVPALALFGGLNLYFHSLLRSPPNVSDVILVCSIGISLLFYTLARYLGQYLVASGKVFSSSLTTLLASVALAGLVIWWGGNFGLIGVGVSQLVVSFALLATNGLRFVKLGPQ